MKPRTIGVRLRVIFMRLTRPLRARRLNRALSVTARAPRKVVPLERREPFDDASEAVRVARSSPPLTFPSEPEAAIQAVAQLLWSHATDVEADYKERFAALRELRYYVPLLFPREGPTPVAVPTDVRFAGDDDAE